MKTIVMLLVVTISLSAQWTKTNFPVDKTIKHVTIADGHIFVVSDTNNVYRSFDDGNSWEIVNSGLNASSISDIIYDEMSNPTLFFVAADSGIFKSTNYGDQWILSSDGISDLYVWHLYKTDNYMFAGCESKNFRSTDSGNTWNEITIGGANQTTRDFVRFDNKLFAVLQNTGTHIYKSEDYGINWLPSDNGIPGDVCLLEGLDSRIFSAFYATLYESSNSGNSWEAIFSGLPPGYPITELKSISDYMFVSALSGVYILHKDSSSVSNITGNLSFTSVQSMDVNSDYIVAGVYNFPESIYEVWTRPTSDITFTTDGGFNLPQTFTLEQNFPNPFNPGTKIKFTIYDLRFTTLKVYDVLGNEVATLVNEEKTPGEYEVEFNPVSGIGNLASGIYFYQLKAGSFIKTKKMVFLK